MPEKKAVPITVAEHDGITDPPTKRVILYGWDGTQKVRVKTNSSGQLDTTASVTPSASQVVVSASHASLKDAAQIWGADGTIATVASLANRNALAVVTVDSTGQIQAPLVSGASVAAYQGGVWNVSVSGGSLGLIPPLTFAKDKVDVSGSSIIVRPLLFATDKVDVSGSSIIVRPLLFATDKVDVSGSSIIVRPLVFATDRIDASGSSVNANVRALVFATDRVDASGSSINVSLNDKTTYPRPDVLNLSASLSNIAPNFAVINVATSGDNAIIAGTTSKKIVVLDYVLVCGAADQVTFKNGISGTAVTGPMRFAANGGISAGYSPVGHFQSASGASLVLNSSLGSQISGHITYVVV